MFIIQVKGIYVVSSCALSVFQNNIFVAKIKFHKNSLNYIKMQYHTLKYLVKLGELRKQTLPFSWALSKLFPFSWAHVLLVKKIVTEYKEKKFL